MPDNCILFIYLTKSHHMIPAEMPTSQSNDFSIWFPSYPNTVLLHPEKYFLIVTVCVCVFQKCYTIKKHITYVEKKCTKPK